MTSEYDAFQVCLNGHSITRDYHVDPGTRKEYCSKCGAKTIHMCPECEAEIRGHLLRAEVFVIGVEPPRFCHACGEPYPWTVSVLKAAEELILLEKSVKTSLKEDVIDTLPDLLEDTPRTQLGVARLNIFLQQAGKGVASGLRNLLVDIASETVVRMIKQGP